MFKTRILVNGERADAISVLDRGFQYGDGLFETIAFIAGKAPMWDLHIQRLVKSCQQLAIFLPDEQLLKSEIATLIGQDGANKIVKLIITRGTGERGYALPLQKHASRIVIMSDWPDLPKACWLNGVRIRMCHTRLANQPLLAGLKHLNRLEQVLARAEWQDPTILEGLVLDQAENLVEATSHNVFLVKNNTIYTPDLTRCGVAGIMREFILSLAANMGLRVNIGDIHRNELDSADEVFLCNSIHGIWPVCEVVTGHKYPVGAITCRLRDKVAEVLPF